MSAERSLVAFLDPDDVQEGECHGCGHDEELCECEVFDG